MDGVDLASVYHLHYEITSHYYIVGMLAHDHRFLLLRITIRAFTTSTMKLCYIIALLVCCLIISNILAMRYCDVDLGGKG